MGAGKTARFLLGLLAIAASLAALSYLLFTVGGVFRRDVSSVAFKEWVSWDYGGLDFGESTVTHSTESSVYTYPYEEQDGAVVIGDKENPYLVLSRLGENKLLTFDGRHVFYLKGSMPEGSVSRESPASSPSSEEAAG